MVGHLDKRCRESDEEKDQIHHLVSYLKPLEEGAADPRLNGLSEKVLELIDRRKDRIGKAMADLS